MADLAERIAKAEEQKKKADEKAKQRAAQLKKLERQQREIMKKERNHRLIRMGAIIEMVLERPTTDEDLKKLEKFLKDQERRGGYFSKAMEADCTRKDEESENRNEGEAFSGSSI